MWVSRFARLLGHAERAGTRGFLSIAFVTLVALIASSAPAFAGSHLGQAPEDHVIVHFWSFGTDGFCPSYQGDQTLRMDRVLPDASVEPFEVPWGRRFVMTDFEVKVAVHGMGKRTGVVSSTLQLVNTATPDAPQIVHDKDFHLVEDHISRNLVIEGGSHAGSVVAPNARLCPSVRFDDDSSGSEFMSITSGTFRGYLIDAHPFEILPPPPGLGSDERG